MIKKIAGLLIIFLLVLTLSNTLSEKVQADYCDIPINDPNRPSLCP